MNQNSVVKEQFNKGAQNFNNWSVTQNERMLKGLADFCELSKNDHLLDVACGTGAFALFAAELVDQVTAIDISEGMIQLAREIVRQRKLENINFICRNVEDIGLKGEQFSVIVSKSAFHHMPNYKKVFSEMVSCCRPGGRIVIQDIMAYKQDKLDVYFEEMERLVDISHYKTYSKSEFFTLFKENGLKLTGIFESESKLDFYDYVEHVVPTDSSYQKITELLSRGFSDPQIAACFLEENGRLLWKRSVCTIIGNKSTQIT